MKKGTILLLLMTLLIGCSGAEESADLDATAAFETAVAAELTRLAPTEPPTSPPAEPTPTLAAVATAAVQVAEPTPVATPTLVPTPTLIPIVKQGAPGDRQGIEGDIFSRSDAQVSAEPAIYSDAITFFLVGAFDTAFGTNEGDGVRQVTFSIFDSDGHLVHEKVETMPSYCAFGGDFPCEPYRFSQHGFRWPSGWPLEEGEFNANVFAQGVNDESIANWTYDFKIELDP